MIPFALEAPLDMRNNFQGITNDDVIYLIMIDRFADGDATNNSPKDSPPEANDRNNPRGFHGGDLRGIINQLPYLKDLGVTALWLTPWHDNWNGVNRCDKPGVQTRTITAITPSITTPSTIASATWQCCESWFRRHTQSALRSSRTRSQTTLVRNIRGLKIRHSLNGFTGRSQIISSTSFETACCSHRTRTKSTFATHWMAGSTTTFLT